MKACLFRGSLLLVIFLYQSLLYAQDKKGKLHLPSADSTVRKEKRIDSLHEARRMTMKMERPDSLRKATRKARKEGRLDSAWIERGRKERRTSVKPDPWQNVRRKKVVVQIPFPQGATLSLRNIMQQVNILSSNSDSVTLVATVNYKGTSSLTDAVWLSKLKVHMETMADEVQVVTGFPTTSEEGNTTFDTIANGVTLFDSLGTALAVRSHFDLPLLLYVPKGVMVRVESRYGDVNFEDQMDSVDASITSGRLQLMDVKGLRVVGNYAKINAEALQSADVDIANGSFKARKIDHLSITSKNSIITLKQVDLLTIRDSYSDQFGIEVAGRISGQKAYGDLLLSSLNGSLQLAGVNSDVKIERIKPSVSEVKLKTQYAVLKLPVGQLSRYEVQYQGDRGKVRAPFPKTKGANDSFFAKVGKEKGTFFDLTCTACTVTF